MAMQERREFQRLKVALPIVTVESEAPLAGG